MPILVGQALADRRGLTDKRPPRFRDTYFAFGTSAAQDTPARGEAFLRPLRDGDLPVRVWLCARWRGVFPPTTVTVFGPDGGSLNSTTVPAFQPVEAPDQFYAPAYACSTGELIIPRARRGATYRVVLEGGNANVMASIIAHAQVVFHLPVQRVMDFGCNAGQYYSGARVFIHTTGEVVRIKNHSRVPLAVRDAQTWELLDQSPLPIPETTEYRLGANRRIAVIVRGYSNLLTFEEGVSPYCSATSEGWFEPLTEDAPCEKAPRP
jgi:hypothetical protein